MNRSTLVQTISAYALAIFGISSTALLNSGTPDAIRHQGFQDFIRGTPGNSGQNVYVSSRGRVEVINKWDLNADGYNDVLISNDHNNFEVVDAFIYWNSASGFRSLLPSLWREMPLAQVAFDLMDRRGGITRLPAFGGGRSVIADLNRDGYPDIVFCNYIHYYPGLRNAFVYWGGPDGYSATNRTELPTNWASGVAAADLNGDGYPELVFANHGTEAGLEEISPDVGQESYIYWGSATGYAPYLRSSLQTFGAASVNVTDLNGDGRADIVFVNQYSGMFNGRVNTHIFWAIPTITIPMLLCPACRVTEPTIRP